MIKFLYSFAHFLCGLIPFKKTRNHLRIVSLYDYKNKLNALEKTFPDLNFKKTQMIKGGWNIGFIVDNKTVFKIRKQFGDQPPKKNLLREKRITDAFRNVCQIQIPKIEVIKAGKYYFLKYDFIPGANINTLKLSTLVKHKEKWGKQLAQFIFSIHNYDPLELADIKKNVPGDGWGHFDICNNIIVDTEKMEISGLIDWEYSGYGYLKTEFENVILFKRNMKLSGIITTIMYEYYNLLNKSLKPVKNKPRETKISV